MPHSAPTTWPAVAATRLTRLIDPRIAIALAGRALVRHDAGPSNTLPTVPDGRGIPMNALEDNRYAT